MWADSCISLLTPEEIEREKMRLKMEKIEMEKQMQFHQPKFIKDIPYN
jgi:hypothetical protein